MKRKGPDIKENSAFDKTENMQKRTYVGDPKLVPRIEQVKYATFLSAIINFIIHMWE